MTLREWRESRARRIISWNMETTAWIYESSMTEEEKEQEGLKFTPMKLILKFNNI